MPHVTTYLQLDPFDTHFVGDLQVWIRNTDHGLRTEYYHEEYLDGTLSPPVRDDLCEFIDGILSSWTHKEDFFKIHVRFVEQVNHAKLH